MTPDALDGREQYLRRVDEVSAVIAAAADQSEQDRRLTEPLVTALHDAGLFRTLLPRTLGGAELDPPSFVEVMEAVGRIDASTAWVLCQTAVCSTVAAYLSPDVAQKLFGPDKRGVLAWGPPTDAHAVPVDGGYRVTGTWTFGSGANHATWLGGACTVVNSDGTPQLRDGIIDKRTMLFPAGTATFTHAWDVLGLRATGSDTYSVRDIFIPREHTVVAFEDYERQHPGMLYCFPTLTLYAAGFGGVALGIARSMLNSMITLASIKTPTGLIRTLHESPVTQSRVAQAEARLRSARAYLLSTLGDVWRIVGESGMVSLDQRAAIRLASTHAIHEARDVVDFAYHAAGATAIFRGSDFERRFRDMHTVTQNANSRHDFYEAVGRVVFGLEPETII